MERNNRRRVSIGLLAAVCCAFLFISAIAIYVLSLTNTRERRPDEPDVSPSPGTYLFPDPEQTRFDEDRSHTQDEKDEPSAVPVRQRLTGTTTPPAVPPPARPTSRKTATPSPSTAPSPKPLPPDDPTPEPIETDTFGPLAEEMEEADPGNPGFPEIRLFWEEMVIPEELPEMTEELPGITDDAERP